MKIYTTCTADEYKVYCLYEIDNDGVITVGTIEKHSFDKFFIELGKFAKEFKDAVWERTTFRDSFWINVEKTGKIEEYLAILEDIYKELQE